MKCPSCGMDNNTVINSRSRKNTIAYYRRRRCLSCGSLFTTKERYCPDELDDKRRIYKGDRW